VPRDATPLRCVSYYERDITNLAEGWWWAARRLQSPGNSPSNTDSPYIPCRTMWR